MAATNYTRTDTPEVAVDLLGMDTRCKGITDFLQTCDTPMTVSIHGDWGTGKTTAMQLIVKELEKPSDQAKGCCVWFNTWQFSVLDNSRKLVIHLMKLILRELFEQAKAHLSKKEIEAVYAVHRKIFEIINVVGGSTVKTLLKTVPHLGLVVDGLLEARGDLKDYKDAKGDPGKNEAFRNAVGNEMDEVDLVINLKKLIKEHVDLLTGEDKPFDRIYVFIDDLDRLEPVVAVELMEGIKNFLDCKNCVFVLAVDSEIVKRGLQAKYGADFTGEKAEKFFDKIIQVPFKLPVNTYQIRRYIQSFLNGNNAEDMAERYEALLSGFDETNPRTIKRCFNLLRLQEKIMTASGAAQLSKESGLRLYALLLFQIECEKLYEKLFVETIKRYRKSAGGYDFEKISEELAQMYEGSDDSEDSEETIRDKCRTAAVLGVFFVKDMGGFSDPDYQNTKEFVSLIQEMTPERSEQRGTGTDVLPDVLKQYYELVAGYDWANITVENVPIKEMVQLDSILVKDKIVSFKVHNHDGNVLMVKINCINRFITLTFYTAKKPMDLFGEYSAKFKAGRATQNSFGYYDNTNDFNPRITVVNFCDPGSAELLAMTERYLDGIRCGRIE